MSIVRFYPFQNNHTPSRRSQGYENVKIKRINMATYTEIGSMSLRTTYTMYKSLRGQVFSYVKVTVYQFIF